MDENLEEAYYWFSLAKLRGNPDAQRGLDFIDKKIAGDVKARAVKRAQESFERAGRR